MDQWQHIRACRCVSRCCLQTICSRCVQQYPGTQKPNRHRKWLRTSLIENSIFEISEKKIESRAVFFKNWVVFLVYRLVFYWFFIQNSKPMDFSGSSSIFPVFIISQNMNFWIVTNQFSVNWRNQNGFVSFHDNRKVLVNIWIHGSIMW
jgi:hypothetical protein